MPKPKSKTGSDGVIYYLQPDSGLYVSTANQRILALKKLGVPYSIHVEVIYLSEIKSFQAHAVLRIATETGLPQVFEGNAVKSVEDIVWGAVACQTAETAAVARAIGKYGIGIEYNFASYDEIQGSGVNHKLVFPNFNDEPEFPNMNDGDEFVSVTKVAKTSTKITKGLENEIQETIKNGKKKLHK